MHFFQPSLQHLWISTWTSIQIREDIWLSCFYLLDDDLHLLFFFPTVICSRCPEWSNYQDSYSERSWTRHGEPAGVWYSCHWAQPLQDPSCHGWRQPQQSCNLSSAYTGSSLCGRCKWEYWGRVYSITYSNYYSEVPKVRARLKFGNLVVESWISEILKIFLIMLYACSYLRYLVKRQM